MPVHIFYISLAEVWHVVGKIIDKPTADDDVQAASFRLTPEKNYYGQHRAGPPAPSPITMRDVLRKAPLAVALLALGAASYWFAGGRPAAGGLALTGGWLLLAAGLGQRPRLRSFAYPVSILAAVTVALTFPQYFDHVGHFPVKNLIVPLLQLITFGVGCTMSWRDLAGVLKMPRAVLIGVLCHYTIMPFVGFAIAKLFGFPPEIAAGVVLVGCMPSGLASNVIAFIAKANLALSVTITAVSTLLAPVMTPLLMNFLGGRLVPVSFSAMFFDILKLVILPVFLGVFFHQFFHQKAKWLNAVMPKLSMVGIACIIVIITAAGRDNLLHVGLALVAAMFLHMTVGVLLGYWGGRLFGLSRLNSRTIAIEVGMQNGGLASGIAAQMGRIATVGLAPAVNGPIMNTTFSLLATWWGRHAPENEPLPAPGLVPEVS